MKPSAALVEAELSDQEIAAINGHKSMQMLNRYTHLRAEGLAPSWTASACDDEVTVSSRNITCCDALGNQMDAATARPTLPCRSMEGEHGFPSA
ncbi:MAG TPA: hypothetical protein VFL78_05935 [Rhodanobacteraceae bacterium]|nr:hypothetical protein [Rhodanobacteraceae bacterium]